MKRPFLIVLSICVLAFANVGLSFAYNDAVGALFTSETVLCPQSSAFESTKAEG
jgi:hypothetical protein